MVVLAVGCMVFGRGGAEMSEWVSSLHAGGIHLFLASFILLEC